jgi:hypothetical protein
MSEMQEALKDLCKRLNAPSYTADDYMAMIEAANEIEYLAKRVESLERASVEQHEAAPADMQEAFERSEFYFNGESPLERAHHWKVWVAAWKAATVPPRTFIKDILRGVAEMYRDSGLPNIAAELESLCGATSAPLEGTGNGAAAEGAIYQISFADEEGWCDTNKKVFDAHPVHARRIVYRAPRTEVAGAVRPPIEYRYEGGTFWCDLGPAEHMHPDFKGVYRLKSGEFPVWAGDDKPSADAAAAPADERAMCNCGVYCQDQGHGDCRYDARAAASQPAAGRNDHICHDGEDCHACDAERAAAAGQEARYVLVPRVLTQAMDGAMHRAWKLGSTQHLWDVALAAAPPARPYD